MTLTCVSAVQLCWSPWRLPMFLLSRCTAVLIDMTLTYVSAKPLYSGVDRHDVYQPLWVPVLTEWPGRPRALANQSSSTCALHCHTPAKCDWPAPRGPADRLALCIFDDCLPRAAGCLLLSHACCRHCRLTLVFPWSPCRLTLAFPWSPCRLALVFPWFPCCLTLMFPWSPCRLTFVFLWSHCHYST